ncbi:MAG: NTP transferase domain-containing protein [Rhodospirillales bacterium]|nr:NTP transferase domain-containing protein [Rhodospirillales bacterium]
MTRSMGDAEIRQCVFLVGGRGTRLGALTDNTPKPLMPVGGRPFLDWPILWAARQGITEIVLLAGYLADQIAGLYDGRIVEGARLRCLTEPEPLGTGGALRFAAPFLAPRFFLANGDTLFDIPLDRLAAAGAGFEACLALRRLEDTGRSGVVRLEGDRIAAFAERGDGRPGLVNGGVYVLDRRIAEDIATPCSLERDVFPSLAARGAMGSRIFEGYFIDIGIPRDLARAQTGIPALAFAHGCG